jgi:hypothetical protein
MVLTVALTGTRSWAADSGSLTTAEFPDVVKFDFKKVHANYERAGESVGKVTPLLDAALQKGDAAAQAGTLAQKQPTEENRKRFLAAVLTFVQGAADGKARISEMAEEVRGIQSQTGILYVQATTQTRARIEALRKEFEREELKLKDLIARNKERRRGATLDDWELRKLFDLEKRQAQVLNRVADRIAFQGDFLKALEKAKDQSVGDFTLYEQFFAEAGDALADIGDLASNLPLVVERLQMASAMAENIPSRRAAVAGFTKIAKTRDLTRKIARQLMDVCSGGLTAGDDAAGDDEGAKVIYRHTEVYRKWVDGEAIQYRRPPQD